MTNWTATSRPLRLAGAVSLLVLTALGLTGCASMSARDRNSAVGAAVGGVAGSVLTNGSAVGTLGGAVVGGVIAREVDTGERKDDRNRRKRDRHD